MWDYTQTYTTIFENFTPMIWIKTFWFNILTLLVNVTSPWKRSEDIIDKTLTITMEIRKTVQLNHCIIKRLYKEKNKNSPHQFIIRNKIENCFFFLLFFLHYNWILFFIKATRTKFKAYSSPFLQWNSLFFSILKQLVHLSFIFTEVIFIITLKKKQ